MFRVLWRFRVIVGVGLALGLALAFLSMVRVNPTGSPVFSYRKHAQFQSETTVLVTVHGFLWGNIKLDAGSVGNVPVGPVDTNVLRNLTSVYITTANSDQVLSLLKKSGPINGKIETSQMLAPDSSTLPLMEIDAIASTPQAALSLANRHLAAFRTWLRASQEASGTPAKNQIVLQAISGPNKPTLLAGRKKTVPILILLATLVAVCGLAFVLENLRPRIHAVEEPRDENMSQARRLSA